MTKNKFIILSILLLGTIFFTYGFISKWYEYLYHKNYCTTKCEGEAINVSIYSYRGRVSYPTTVKYLDVYQIMEHWDYKLNKGDKVIVNYDPNNPQKAYIPEVNDSEPLIIILFGIISLVSICGTIMAFRFFL